SNLTAAASSPAPNPPPGPFSPSSRRPGCQCPGNGPTGKNKTAGRGRSAPSTSWATGCASASTGRPRSPPSCRPPRSTNSNSMTEANCGHSSIQRPSRYTHHDHSRTLKKGQAMKLSARNQIPARVTSINAGEAIANVELDANGVRLVASITVSAVRDLGLAEGSNVTAVIKASDVMVAAGYCNHPLPPGTHDSVRRPASRPLNMHNH